MKIINIVPGFGGTFYCGNCLRDSAYAASLREEGHDAVILPVYLPLSMKNKHEQGEIPVFYGAVNIYLKQQFPILRKMPSWMEHLLDSPLVLDLAARKAGSTRANGMEDLTESMLRGEDGFQNRELQQLVDFLKYHEKPDVVHLSNALLLGMAEKIRREVGVPVVCSLQDEDVWMDAMDPGRQRGIWQLLSEKAQSVDAFIAVSSYFARLMQAHLSIPGEKLHVVPIGVKPDNYMVTTPAFNPQAIGYLSRICHENGFEILVDAFILLKKEGNFRELKLHVTGGMTSDDRPFLKKQLEKLKQCSIRDDLVLFDDFSLEGLKRFFSTLTLLSVPVLKGEAFGLYQVEAMASGIPLVQPELGAFPEIIKTSGGGVIYSPNTAAGLAYKLKEVLSVPEKLNEMSIAGRKAVEETFNCRKLTEKMIEVYQRVRKLSVES
jgi:glycosyltransferase involved in cell wall biosynthesis